MTPSAETAHADSRTLAASLAPLVAQACQGRLGQIVWFRTDWQRGGAATGRSTFGLPDGSTTPVVLKFPVVQRELLWTQRLQHNGAAEYPAESALVTSPGDSKTNPHNLAEPIPRLYASGNTIGGYDLAWIIIEHLPYGPLGLHWHEDHIPRMCEAAARFHAAADAFPVDQPPKSEPWLDLLHDASESVRLNHITNQQRWSMAIKTLRQRIHRLLEEWDARDVNHWLHGDLHLANTMSRVGLESGPVCLIDLAEVHSGHWIEDAVYLERQLWARPERLNVHKPVKTMATWRKALGLPVEGDYPRLAMIRRALLAGTAPKFIKSEGHPAYMDACLSRLEIALNDLKNR